MQRRSFLKLCGAVALTALAPITAVAKERHDFDEALLMKLLQEKIEQMEADWNKRVDELLLKDGPVGSRTLSDAGFNIVANRTKAR